MGDDFVGVRIAELRELLLVATTNRLDSTSKGMAHYAVQKVPSP